MTYSKKTLRLFKRTFATEDIDGFLKNVTAPPSAQTPLDVSAHLLLERFGQMLKGFDESFLESEDRLKTAIRNIEVSSQELNETNLKLERINGSLNAVLEGLGQGLLFFNRNGICSSIYSKSCLHLFEKDPSGLHITEVLALDGDAAERLKYVTSVIFNPEMTALGFDDLIHLAPKSYAHSQHLDVELDYRTMKSSAGAITGILVIGTDITRILADRENLERNEALITRTLKIAKDREGYTRFVSSLDTAMSDLKSAISLTKLRRDVHTLKGMSRVYFLEDLSTALHNLETGLSLIDDVSAPSTIAAHIPALDREAERARQYGRDLWGDNFLQHVETVSVSAEKITEFRQKMLALSQNNLTAESILRIFHDSIASAPAEDAFTSFENNLGYFSEMSDKPLEVCYINQDGVRITALAYRAFLDTLVLVARNIIDHAIEDRETRRNIGKPEKATVEIRFEYAQDKKNFTIRIKDDGRGLDTAKIRAILAAKGIPPPSDKNEDIWQHIFDDNFSTSDSVSLNSGRGVGMGAVRQAVEGLGGHIAIHSVAGKGAMLEVTLPLL